MTWRSLEGSRPRLDHKWIHHASPKGKDNSTSVAERFTLKKGEKSWDPFTAKDVPACLKINFPKKKMAVQRNAERFLKVTKQPKQPKQDVFFLDLQGLKQLPSSKMLPWFRNPKQLELPSATPERCLAATSCASPTILKREIRCQPSGWKLPPPRGCAAMLGHLVVAHVNEFRVQPAG